jgi:predicted N-acetyltransferase YhbS
MSSSAVVPSPLLPPSILIERPEHARAVEVLVDRAFGPAGSPSRPSACARAIASWTTARSWPCMDGRVIGSVRLWPVTVGGKPAAFLGPLAVDADERSHGLGQALVEAACAAAAKAGWRAVLLVGDAPYFGRVGFAAEPAAQAIMPGPADQRRVLVKALVEGGDKGWSVRSALRDLVA